MSEKLPVLKAKEVIRILERAGFFIHHQTGSHAQMKHSKKNELRITIPIHSGDLPIPVLRSILKQAQLTVEEFSTFR